MTPAPAERLHRLAQTWSAAGRGWNPAALAGLYCEDAVLFGGLPGHAVGRAQIQSYFQSYAGTILSASLVLLHQELLVNGDLTLLAQGFADFAFTLPAGDTRQRMRTTWLLDWAGGETQIRAHHFSPEPDEPPLGR